MRKGHSKATFPSQSWWGSVAGVQQEMDRWWGERGVFSCLTGHLHFQYSDKTEIFSVRLVQSIKAFQCRGIGKHFPGERADVSVQLLEVPTHTMGQTIGSLSPGYDTAVVTGQGSEILPILTWHSNTSFPSSFLARAIYKNL